MALRGAANLRDKASNRTTIDFENVQSSEVTNAYKSAIADSQVFVQILQGIFFLYAVLGS